MGKSKWNKSEQSEILLSDLLWKILRGWRFVIIMLIAFVVIFTGYKYRSDQKIRLEADVSSKKDTDLMETLTDQEKKDLKIVKQLQKTRDAREKYKKESILMNLDASKKNVVTLQYYVDTGYTYNYLEDVTQDYSGPLVNAYIAYIENKGILRPVCEKLNQEDREQYIGELITAGCRFATDGNQIDAADTSGRIFAVYIAGKDMKEANELADAVSEAITSYQPLLTEQIGTHTLSLIDRYESIVIDNNLSSQQSNYDDYIATIQTRIDNMISAFSTTQKSIYDSENSATVSNATIAEMPVTINKKYIVLGALVGIFIACCWITMGYIFGKKIRSSEELQDAYGMRVFGEVTLTEEKKRLFGGIDRWIDRLQHKEKWTRAEQKDMILANLITTCRKESIDQVFVTTSLHQSEQEKAVTEAILEEVRKAGIAVTFGENVARNARSLEQMSGIGRVIVIEHVGETEYTSLEKELDLCVQQKAEVLGAIALV